MSSGAENEDSDNYVPGFGSLASFIVSDSDHSPFIYRRFDKLGARDLIYYQSQLAQLQAEQDELDIQDSIDVQSNEREGEEQRKQIHRCVSDWKAFEDAALSSESSPQVPMNGTPTTWKRRMDLAMRIRTTLKDYREALIQESTLLSMPIPSAQAMTAMSGYFHRHKSSLTGRFAVPMAYSELSGASSSLYPLNMSNSQIRASDYVSLSKPTDPDILTNILRTKLSWLFRTTPPPPPLPQYHTGQAQPTISHRIRPSIRYFSHERLRFTVSFITTLAAAILLFVPIVTLYNTSSSRPWLTLGLIAMFTMIFAVSLWMMTTATRSEIFGACAAYSAVLVVFVSGDFTSGGNGV